jgi:inorganic phosphate transporter, PiT family
MSTNSTQNHFLTAVLQDYRSRLEAGTRFIPTWVKVSVAIALGTMVGWRRITI